MQGDDANRRRHDRDFWHARQTFLKSYNFSGGYGRDDDGLRGKMKRSMKEFSRSTSRMIGGVCAEGLKESLELGFIGSQSVCHPQFL